MAGPAVAVISQSHFANILPLWKERWFSLQGTRSPSLGEHCLRQTLLLRFEPLEAGILGMGVPGVVPS